MSDTVFSKENLDTCLKELGKEYKKLAKTMPAEIILVGGASILANYGFRENTYDVDAVINASSAMKEAINKVADKMNLPDFWLNTDFRKTASYTPKLSEYSEYYKTFSNILTVRTISGEYLIAMKLVSARAYKNDRSDIIGILASHKKEGKPITLDEIKRAVSELYGSWEEVKPEIRDFISSALNYPDIEKLYEEIRLSEKNASETLLDFDEKYPNALREDNIDEILSAVSRKQK